MPGLRNFAREKSGRSALRVLIGALVVAAFAAIAPAQAQDKQVLVLGVDISDARNFDPARMADYSSPITNGAVYDSLVTQLPGAYEEVVPSLATAWERLDDGQRIRFKIGRASCRERV